MTIFQIGVAALLFVLAPATMPVEPPSQSICQTNCAGNSFCEFWQDFFC